MLLLLGRACCCGYLLGLGGIVGTRRLLLLDSDNYNNGGRTFSALFRASLVLVVSGGEACACGATASSMRRYSWTERLREESFPVVCRSNIILIVIEKFHLIGKGMGLWLLSLEKSQVTRFEWQQHERQGLH